MSFWEKVAAGLMVLFVSPILLISFLLFFVALPRMLYVERQCLQRGYPHATVDWTLEGYCMNLEGTVTVRVDSIRGATP